MHRVVVFDMDETLGFFQQINYLWQLIKHYIPYFNNNYFNILLDLYPEFLRPNIIIILNYLKEKKKNNNCDNIIIYTNNKTSKEWVTLIQNYFNIKLNYQLFDKIICAFKINNTIIEPNRTTYTKTFNDLISCTQLDPNTKIFYLDDKYYHSMNKNNLLYIKLKAYKYELDKKILFKRLSESPLINKITLHIFDKIKHNYKYILIDDIESIIIHKILSKKIIQHLNKFFSNNYKTLKKNINIHKKNTTKKILNNCYNISC